MIYRFLLEAGLSSCTPRTTWLCWAAVAWYGKLVGDTSPIRRSILPDIATDLNAPAFIRRRQIPVFHRRAWKPCVRRYAPLNAKAGNRGLSRMQGTRLMPIIVRDTTKPRRKIRPAKNVGMVRAVRGKKRLTTAHSDVCWAYEAVEVVCVSAKSV